MVTLAAIRLMLHRLAHPNRRRSCSTWGEDGLAL
jgi:hypothetical protein